ncbi:hypothetical protein N0V85_008863, partial [Neurospora sp. IMI 360204]
MSGAFTFEDKQQEHMVNSAILLAAKSPRCSELPAAELEARWSELKLGMNTEGQVRIFEGDTEVYCTGFHTQGSHDGFNLPVFIPPTGP